jgi:Na+-transporting methylmalonyl-CoA/oxaloacetate decarboxylase gamma subunit
MARIAGSSYGWVFLFLIILAVVVWLVGIGIRRASKKANNTSDNEGEE